jgi:hypothetical protein
MFKCFIQLAVKLEALRDEYMRYATEKCSSVLREYHSAVETITGLVLDLVWFTC